MQHRHLFLVKKNIPRYGIISIYVYFFLPETSACVMQPDFYIYIYIYVDTGKSHVCITSRNKNATQALMGAFQNRLKSIKLFTTWTSGIYIK